MGIVMLLSLLQMCSVLVLNKIKLLISNAGIAYACSLVLILFLFIFICNADSSGYDVFVTSGFVNQCCGLIYVHPVHELIRLSISLF